MEDVFKIAIGAVILVFGFYIGNFLARVTKEELKKNQKLFRWVIIFSLLVGFVVLFFMNDTIMFSSFFIAIVTSRCLNTSRFAFYVNSLL
ncbi:MAG: hypothetical protein AABX30_02385 [Nanoarchaeota archaeon]